MLKVKELELEFIFSGRRAVIYPTLIEYKGELILVDAGYANMFMTLKKAFEKNGELLSKLKSIWITHHDYDHIGSLHAIKERFPHVKIYAGADEVPYIEGRKESLRMEQAVRLQTSLSDEEQSEGLKFQLHLKTMEPEISDKVDFLLYDNMTLLDNKIKVIGTPGHTKGHMSFYLTEEKTLITGDAIILNNGRLEIPFPQFSENLEKAKESVIKLSQLPLKKIMCYHGGTLEGTSENLKKEILKALET